MDTVTVAALIGAGGAIGAAIVGLTGRFIASRRASLGESTKNRDESVLLDAIKLPVFILSRLTNRIEWVNDYTTRAYNRSSPQLKEMTVTDIINHGSEFITDPTIKKEAKQVYYEVWNRFLKNPRLPLYTLPIPVKFGTGLEGPAMVVGFPIYESQKADPTELLVIVFVDKDWEISKWVREQAQRHKN